MEETEDDNHLQFLKDCKVEHYEVSEIENTFAEQMLLQEQLEAQFEQDSELKSLVKRRNKLLAQLKSSQDSADREELRKLEISIREKKQYIAEHQIQNPLPSIKIDPGVRYTTREEQDRVSNTLNFEEKRKRIENDTEEAELHFNDSGGGRLDFWNDKVESLPKMYKSSISNETVSSIDSVDVDDLQEADYHARLYQIASHRDQALKVFNPGLTSLSEGYHVDSNLYNSLFEHQKVAVRWIWELYRQEAGGILGDEMGLGKTLDIVSFLQGLFLSGLLAGPVLVVCPATVVKHWMREFHRWAPIFRVVIGLKSLFSGKFSIRERVKECSRIFQSPNCMQSLRESLELPDYNEASSVLSRDRFSYHVNHSAVVMITTYETCRTYIDSIVSVRWSCCVMDEGHKLRNASTALSIACKQIETQFKIILSGTPIQNSLLELWSLFDFCFPGKLGTLEKFEESFVVPIKSGSYANSSETQISIAYQCALILHDLVSPYLLRRSKEQIKLKLPKKMEQILLCKLTAAQREQYLAFLKSKKADLIYSGKMNVLYGINILRKICNHTWLLDDDHGRSKIADCKTLEQLAQCSCKIDLISHILRQWHEHSDPPNRVLLFVQTLQMMRIIEKLLELSNYSFLRMDGSVAIKKRQKLIDQFNDTSSNVFIFLLTTKVGGLGLNLTRANRVIIFDPDWNPTTDIQAKERTYRIGQKNQVIIYRLVTSGTIEEKIYYRQIYKQFLSNKILKNPKKSRTSFSYTEIKLLFALENSAVKNKIYENVKNVQEDLVDPVETTHDANSTSEESQKDSMNWMFSEVLGKNKKIVKLLNHENVLENSESSGRQASNKISEDDAKKLALNAARSLQNSYASKTAIKNLFGKTQKSPIIKEKNYLKSGLSSPKPISSDQIKSSIKKFSVGNKSDEESDAQSLLLNLYNFLKSKPSKKATSDELVLQFKGIDQSQMLIFRELLRQIANFDPDESTWKLHDWILEL